MAKRSALLLVSLLVLGFAAAGCGGDDDNGADAGGGAFSQDSTERSAGGPGPGEEEAAQGEEECKQSVAAQPRLSDDVKADLERICEKAADGDQEAVREASRDVCVTIVEDTVPAGTTREQALEACDDAGGAP